MTVWFQGTADTGEDRRMPLWQATHLAPSTYHLTRCHITSDAEETWRQNAQAKKIQAENGAGNAIALIGAISRTLIYALCVLSSGLGLFLLATTLRSPHPGTLQGPGHGLDISDLLGLLDSPFTNHFSSLTPSSAS